MIKDLTQYLNAGHIIWVPIQMTYKDCRLSYEYNGEACWSMIFIQIFSLKSKIISRKECNVVTRFTFFYRIRTPEKPQDTLKPVYLTMFLICEKHRTDSAFEGSTWHLLLINSFQCYMTHTSYHKDFARFSSHSPLYDTQILYLHYSVR